MLLYLEEPRKVIICSTYIPSGLYRPSKMIERKIKYFSWKERIALYLVKVKITYN